MPRPMDLPTNAVPAIARAPQNVTRSAPLSELAPPVRAATTPMQYVPAPKERDYKLIVIPRALRLNHCHHIRFGMSSLSS